MKKIYLMLVVSCVMYVLGSSILDNIVITCLSFFGVLLSACAVAIDEDRKHA